MRYVRVGFWTLVVLALVFSLFPSASWAGLEFCSTDPIFQVDGQTVRVVVNLAPGSLLFADWEEPVEVTLTAPEGTHPRVLATTGPIPEVAFVEEEGDQEVVIEVEVPDVEGYQFMEVHVFVNGQEVATASTSEREVTVSFPWNR